MSQQHDLKPDQRCCVADGITTQREILRYRPVYLKGCVFHSQLLKDAEERDRAREQRRVDLRDPR